MLDFYPEEKYNKLTVEATLIIQGRENVSFKEEVHDVRSLHKVMKFNVHSVNILASRLWLLPTVTHPVLYRIVCARGSCLPPYNLYLLLNISLTKFQLYRYITYETLLYLCVHTVVLLSRNLSINLTF